MPIRLPPKASISSIMLYAPNHACFELYDVGRRRDLRIHHLGKQPDRHGFLITNDEKFYSCGVPIYNIEDFLKL